MSSTAAGRRFRVPRGRSARCEKGRTDACDVDPRWHEFIGVVEEIGSEVRSFAPGDVVVAPFLISDGTCEFCREGLPSSCRRLDGWGYGTDGGQGEAARVPLADGTLYKLPVGEDDELMPSLLTLSDVFATGHHAAVSARVGAGSAVTVIGDGAVGLCAVPQYDRARLDQESVFFRNVTITGGAAPARAYIPELLPDVLDGTVRPGRVFDRTIGLDEVPEGYRAMNDREALRVLIRP